MKRLLICLLLLPLCGTAFAGGKRLKAPEKTVLQMVDPQATPATTIIPPTASAGGATRIART